MCHQREFGAINSNEKREKELVWGENSELYLECVDYEVPVEHSNRDNYPEGK